MKTSSRAAPARRAPRRLSKRAGDLPAGQIQPGKVQPCKVQPAKVQPAKVIDTFLRTLARLDPLANPAAGAGQASTHGGDA
jgi:hypothetical protein